METLQQQLSVVVGRRIRFNGDICNQPGEGVIVELPDPDPGCASGTLILFDGRKMGFHARKVREGESYRYRLLDKIHGREVIEMAMRKHAEVEAARVIEEERAKVLFDEAMRRLIAENPHLEARTPDTWGTAAWVAKNVRRALKHAAIKPVSVRSDAHSIRIKVHREDVAVAESVCFRFKAGSFDGMTDCYNYRRTPWTEAFGDSEYVWVDAIEDD